ncbi:MAG: hypothetical protein R3D58_03635 [Saprospiraceae bacterium]
MFFPVLHTERLKLRQLQVDDFPSLILYANNKAISNNILNIPHPSGEPNAVHRISYVVQGFKNKSRFAFATTLRANASKSPRMGRHLGSIDPMIGSFRPSGPVLHDFYMPNSGPLGHGKQDWSQLLPRCRPAGPFFLWVSGNY